jgi:hypothetical protein
MDTIVCHFNPFTSLQPASQILFIIILLSPQTTKMPLSKAVPQQHSVYISCYPFCVTYPTQSNLLNLTILTTPHKMHNLQSTII